MLDRAAGEDRRVAVVVLDAAGDQDTARALRVDLDGAGSAAGEGDRDAVIGLEAMGRLNLRITDGLKFGVIGLLSVPRARGPAFNFLRLIDTARIFGRAKESITLLAGIDVVIGGFRHQSRLLGDFLLELVEIGRILGERVDAEPGRRAARQRIGVRVALTDGEGIAVARFRVVLRRAAAVIGGDLPAGAGQVGGVARDDAIGILLDQGLAEGDVVAVGDAVAVRIGLVGEILDVDLADAALGQVDAVEDDVAVELVGDVDGGVTAERPQLTPALVGIEHHAGQIDLTAGRDDFVDLDGTGPAVVARREAVAGQLGEIRAAVRIPDDLLDLGFDRLVDDEIVGGAAALHEAVEVEVLRLDRHRTAGDDALGSLREGRRDFGAGFAGHRAAIGLQDRLNLPVGIATDGIGAQIRRHADRHGAADIEIGRFDDAVGIDGQATAAGGLHMEDRGRRVDVPDDLDGGRQIAFASTRGVGEIDVALAVGGGDAADRQHLERHFTAAGEGLGGRGVGARGILGDDRLTTDLEVVARRHRDLRIVEEGAAIGFRHGDAADDEGGQRIVGDLDLGVGGGVELARTEQRIGAHDDAAGARRERAHREHLHLPVDRDQDVPALIILVEFCEPGGEQLGFDAIDLALVIGLERGIVLVGRETGRRVLIGLDLVRLCLGEAETDGDRQLRQRRGRAGRPLRQGDGEALGALIRLGDRVAGGVVFLAVQPHRARENGR